ncbi:prepilin-type N-terminal cleavage/methylation domain-containing protein [Inconstantimicrobium mannanitabidum]|uniref:Uncharacterized protein n=1 Tax=Inconstantimicrobium mannanitabidum TaxID=1604901 RepID=A0ACB5R7J9_9CLOT|nr:prepilin-type N-terminal cleavage/methylation domain-containing protein [Clostridium sp. TW13]GKX64839.1 hypothetical protein rsdtw13_00970 [Clostridium sp. TW13]
MKQLLKTKRKRKGFTLIELIIVIAIIAILVAVAIPKFSEIRKNANASADLATAKTIHSLIAAETTASSGAVADTASNVAVPDSILNKLDGAKKPKGGTAFTYTMSNGDIKIYIDNASVPVYPN